MRRTLTMAAATAALTLVGGPLPAAEARGPALALGRWSAVEARAFWTPERMASATPAPPLPDTGPGSSGPAPTAPAVAPPAVAPPAVAPPAVAPSAAAPPAAAPSAVVPAPVAAATPAVPAPSPATDPVPAAPSTPSVSPVPVPVPAPTPTPTPAPAVVPAPAKPVSPVRPSLLRAKLATAAASPGIGQDFDGIPVVGRMFVMTGGGAYFCTASVVSSPGRNLVLSAAHCLLGSDARQVAFVPMYTAQDPQPYGMFPIVRDAAGHSKVWIAPRYRTDGADRAATLDVAFAQVGPDAHGNRVEDVVGGNRLVTDSGYALPSVTLIGHPASAARPRLCVNRTTKFTSTDPKIPGSFLRIDCTGYPGGTSGGPFLTHFDPDTETGDVVGVIGGWKTGGDTDDTSYSAYFGSEIRALYETAVAAARVV